MANLKHFILTFIYLCLLMAFLCAINDPGAVTGIRASDNLYSSFAPFLDPLYALANTITTPVQWIFIIFGLYHPGDTTSWFPVSNAASFSQFLAPLGWSGIITANSFQGVLFWWMPTTMLLLYLTVLSAEHAWTSSRNWVWNMIIEYFFHRNKAQAYAEALDKQKADLVRLNNQYRALAQETHSLKDSVITDELTKVFNKRFFVNRIQSEFDKCKSERTFLSIIMIDIDFFKRLNDTYGHLSGDHVLMAVADVLKRSSPEQCYPCRYGGEEFSIIMPRKTLPEAMETAKFIQDNTQQLRFDDIDKKLRVTVSQGVCTVDFSQPDLKTLTKVDSILEIADQQLYRSKMEGRNRISSQLYTTPKIN